METGKGSWDPLAGSWAGQVPEGAGRAKWMIMHPMRASGYGTSGSASSGAGAPPKPLASLLPFSVLTKCVPCSLILYVTNPENPSTPEHRCMNQTSALSTGKTPPDAPSPVSAFTMPHLPRTS